MKPVISNSSHIVADGAWGTELLRMGVDAGGCPEEWNLTHADKIEHVARAYIDAGSQIILTNTFRANVNVLDEHGLLAQMDPINQRGAEISRRAAGADNLVFGSIGPYGKLISLDQVSDEEVAGSVARQCRALLQGGVDGIALETMADLAELALSIRTIRAITDLPVVAAMSYDSGPSGQCTMLGVSPEEAARECAEAGADIIGSNCGLGIDNSVRICRALRQHTDLPLWIKANAGFPELVNDMVVYSMDAIGFAEFTHELVHAGANVIGGCCGTNSEHITAVANRLKH